MAAGGSGSEWLRVVQDDGERPLLPECALVKKIYWEDARASWGARSRRIPFGREGNWVCFATSPARIAACPNPLPTPWHRPLARPRPSSLLNCFFCQGVSRKMTLPTQHLFYLLLSPGIGWRVPGPGVDMYSYITFLTSETNAIVFFESFSNLHLIFCSCYSSFGSWSCLIPFQSL